MSVHVHMHRKAKDLATNKSGEPATDMERRNCICEVAKLADCSRGTAENYLKLNSWNIQRSVADLERDRKQGFVVDSVRDGKVLYVQDKKVVDATEAELGQKVRTAYEKLKKAFEASGGERNRAWREVNKEFTAANYEYHKTLGKWHPLAREMD